MRPFLLIWFCICMLSGPLTGQDSIRSEAKWQKFIPNPSVAFESEAGLQLVLYQDTTLPVINLISGWRTGFSPQAYTFLSVINRIKVPDTTALSPGRSVGMNGLMMMISGGESEGQKLSERIFESRSWWLDEQAFNHSKKLLVDEVAKMEANPLYRVQEKVAEILGIPGHLLHGMPHAATLSATTFASYRDFLSRLFESSNTLLLAGGKLALSDSLAAQLHSPFIAAPAAQQPAWQWVLPAPPAQDSFATEENIHAVIPVVTASWISPLPEHIANQSLPLQAFQLVGQNLADRIFGFPLTYGEARFKSIPLPNFLIHQLILSPDPINPELFDSVLFLATHFRDSLALQIHQMESDPQAYSDLNFLQEIRQSITPQYLESICHNWMLLGKIPVSHFPADEFLPFLAESDTAQPLLLVSTGKSEWVAAVDAFQLSEKKASEEADSVIHPPDMENFTVYFEFNSFKPDSLSLNKLDSFATLMRNNPEQEFWVDGHSDSKGDQHVNMQISRLRARKVKDYLIETYGISGERLIIRAFGEENPAVEEKTDKDRAQNRRVEFKMKDPG